MDKTWMQKNRRSKEYWDGLQKFLDYAFQNSSINGMILCPCKECKCGVCVTRENAELHLKVYGFVKGYTHWAAHGEFVYSSAPKPTSHDISHGVRDELDDMHGLVHDALGISEQDQTKTDGTEYKNQLPNGEAEKFYNLIDNSNKELYSGCKRFSKLSFMIRLLHLKCLGKLSNKIFDMLLDLLKEAFPDAMDGLPKSYYEAEKLMKELGLGYDKYDACPNDCTLYWGVDASRKYCETCKESRWIKSENDPTGEGRKIPHKVLWHFPLKHRLQRLFMSSKIAGHMRWHVEGRTKDGNMRHPADSPSWQTFDFQHPEFSQDSRNVRLGLASDGFNPFKNMSSTHSTWPVILMPYNLPPWMCMKQPNFMLSLLIPGPFAPGNNIDIYLKPLIAELKELWDVGVNTYDASRKENFQLRAALLWTISDFPGYAILSGWSTKGKLACPVCHKYTSSQHLQNWGKYCYMGHRRYLEMNHPFRKDAKSFNGSVEYGKPPGRLMGSAILDELAGYGIKLGKKVSDNPELPFNWKKLSIFFDLPYWKDNMIRHNLDVMHIEKNICESIVATLLNLEKTKDNKKSRLDLRDMGIRSELHPIEKGNGRSVLPPACFTLKKKEKEMFCKVLKGIKVPDGYAANISRCVKVKPPKISGLKSHDYHILMQQLLPIALRRTLSKAVRSPLIKLSRYFRKLCSKVLDPADLVHLEKEIGIILCQLERIFPPPFFNVMVHLAVHLVSEAKIAGPVHYRWMYPIERYLGTLKSYVRNRSRPEGCIAEGYLAEECLNFCSLYLADYVETKFNRTSRNDDVGETSSERLDIFSSSCRPLGKGTPTNFSNEILRKAHQYVLFNCDHIKPYVDQHHKMVEEQNPHAGKHVIERIHCENFADWFSNHVKQIQVADGVDISKDLKLLARGPNNVGRTYKKILVNGFRFHTRQLESQRKTQNSGVLVNATTSSFSSTKDNNPILSDMAYYGILTNILELNYTEGRIVTLFECDWISKGKRLKQDEDGFTLANFKNVKPHPEPYVIATQVSQVFYVADPVAEGWSVVVATSPRNEFMMDPVCDTEMYLQSTITLATQMDNENEDIRWVREDDGDEILH
ncbi:uncharacterized protein [Coffea arabica]|uniref:Uncharacterized protein isoform X1 n=2 Tax=Coffea arabica TaxID=13443 RepID=A0ABM4UHZ0_COFAR